MNNDPIHITLVLRPYGSQTSSEPPEPKKRYSISDDGLVFDLADDGKCIGTAFNLQHSIDLEAQMPEKSEPNSKRETGFYSRYRF